MLGVVVVPVLPVVPPGHPEAVEQQQGDGEEEAGPAGEVVELAGTDEAGEGGGAHADGTAEGEEGGEGAGDALPCPQVPRHPTVLPPGHPGQAAP